MRKRSRLMVAVLLIGIGAFLLTQRTAAAHGGIYYESRPDEAALYLSDIAFVRDTVMLPAGQDTRVLLPPGTYPGTLILTENGARVRNYRIRPQAADVYYGGAYTGGGSAYILTWDSEAAEGEMRQITLEYLLPGASWTPTYDMVIVDDESVQMAFYAEIRNAALVLDGATVYLVAGRVELSGETDQVSQVTMNQYAVGYSDANITLPTPNVGAVDLQHVYPVGEVTAEPGDTVYVSLAEAALDARKQVVWNASTDQETDVIYKVTNATDVPLAEGIVRVYQNDLFMGSDFMETTPIGGEGSVTVGTLPDVRVHRTHSQEYRPDGGDYYLHTVTLEIGNFRTEDVALLVLDVWLEGAWDFEYSSEPVRGQDNLLRWEVTVPAGERLTITYQFKTGY